MSTKQKESWGSRLGLILAMAGNAIGLGNFLRFPVQAVQNGGGAFMIPYITCFLLLGIPMLWVEWAMGRFGGKFGHHSPPFILEQMDRRWFWKYLGVFGIFINVAVAGYYCYLESWTMAYVWHSAAGSFKGMDQASVAQYFDQYLDYFQTGTGIPYENIFFYVVCVGLNVWILSRGLQGGIEAMSKIGMPLLIFFAIFLAICGINLQAGEHGAAYDGTVGLNFFWQPRFDSLANPKVWLAAAGQIFFTLSVGMGTIQCFASYVSEKDDIALNAMSAGWMTEVVEVVIGSCILIPISVGYLGIDKVIELTKSGGLGLAFRTMPFLFQQWGQVFGLVAGVAFFGLLFFAGITSSLAMGMPWMGFLEDEFGWKRKATAWTFGAVTLVLGLPSVIFYRQGVFDEYDYWAGTVAIVIFALVEAVIFSFIFGLKRGWPEITRGAEIQVPLIYKPIIRFVAPTLLFCILVGSMFAPVNADWAGALASLTGGQGWPLDDGAILAKITNQGLYRQMDNATDINTLTELKDRILYVNASRGLLLVVWLLVAYMVFVASQRRRRNRILNQNAV